MIIIDTKILTRDGLEILIQHVHDEYHGAPWDNEDGHGPVSKWTNRDKHAGELVLCSDRDSKRYYDYAEAVRIAKRDGWGPGKPHEAARADYDRLRAWCNDEWYYIGIVATIGNVARASLWGIESDSSDDYLAEVADDLASEALYDLRQVALIEVAACE